MNGKFYAEAYSIDFERAEKIGAFMDNFQSEQLLKDVRVWCKHDKARVYFEMNSQNSLGAFKPAFKFFYDAGMTEIEFISKPIDVNAESAVIALKESGEIDVEKKLSLKLLYGLTQDLKHLQYHGMDYLFLKLNKA